MVSWALPPDQPIAPEKYFNLNYAIEFMPAEGVVVDNTSVYAKSGSSIPIRGYDRETLVARRLAEMNPSTGCCMLDVLATYSPLNAQRQHTIFE